MTKPKIMGESDIDAKQLRQAWLAERIPALLAEIRVHRDRCVAVSEKYKGTQICPDLPHLENQLHDFLEEWRDIDRELALATPIRWSPVPALA